MTPRRVTADLLILALEDARNAALRVKAAIEKERELKAGRPTLVPLEIAGGDLVTVVYRELLTALTRAAA